MVLVDFLAYTHGKFLSFGTLKRYFLHFEGTFEKKIAFLTVFLTMFTKYSGPNEITLSF